MGSKKSDLHKRSVSSFTNDIEKFAAKESEELEDVSDDEDVHKPTKVLSRVDFLLVVLIILCVGTVFNLVLISNFANRNPDSKSIIQRILNYFDTNFTFGNNDHVDNDLNNILNVDSIDNKNLNEWEKFVNELNEDQDNTVVGYPDGMVGNEHVNDLNMNKINEILNDDRLPESYKDTLRREKDRLQKSLDDSDAEDNDMHDGHTDDTNPQSDLAEILSINSIVLLINDENLLKQERVKQILFSLNINPELKIVDIKKHPNYKNILGYLKDFNTNLEHGAREDLDIDFDASDIPRLFISGWPVAGYADIITKYDKGDLSGYLKTVGDGSITLEL